MTIKALLPIGMSALIGCFLVDDGSRFCLISDGRPLRPSPGFSRPSRTLVMLKLLLLTQQKDSLQMVAVVCPFPWKQTEAGRDFQFINNPIRVISSFAEAPHVSLIVFSLSRNT